MNIPNDSLSILLRFLPKGAIVYMRSICSAAGIVDGIQIFLQFAYSVLQGQDYSCIQVIKSTKDKEISVRCNELGKRSVAQILPGLAIDLILCWETLRAPRLGAANAVFRFTVFELSIWSIREIAHHDDITLTIREDQSHCSHTSTRLNLQTTFSLGSPWSLSHGLNPAPEPTVT